MKLPDNPLAKPDNAPKPLYVVQFHTLKEAKTAALDVARVFQLRFDNLRFTISFPAFDLKFTNYNDKLLRGYRNVIDVAELDELILWYKKEIRKGMSKVSTSSLIFKGVVDTVSDLPETAELGDVWRVGTTDPINNTYVYSGTDWVRMSTVITQSSSDIELTESEESYGR